jgi:hypothetical protein
MPVKTVDQGLELDPRPELTIRRINWLSLFPFRWSGGFEPGRLIPSRFAAAVVGFEGTLPVAVRRFFGFCVLAAPEMTE